MDRLLDTDPLGFLIDWLDQSLPAGVHVGDDRADQLPSVVVRADGGAERRIWTGSAQLGVNVWAATDREAQALALEVRSWIEHATQCVECVEASCSLPIELVDNSGHPRRYLAATLTLTQRVA
ncbi:hypothetical protein LG274_02685 [Micrococcus antarcticus]|uniref:hypothetical protein n=1 Tax=Micrococcus antarcticus TaxID=86171 RepID=UPI00385164D9